MIVIRIDVILGVHFEIFYTGVPKFISEAIAAAKAQGSGSILLGLASHWVKVDSFLVLSVLYRSGKGASQHVLFYEYRFKKTKES